MIVVFFLHCDAPRSQLNGYMHMHFVTLYTSRYQALYFVDIDRKCTELFPVPDARTEQRDQ